MATALDPNFQRTDTPVFDSVRLTAPSAQIQGAGGKTYTLPSGSGTFRTTGSGQPVTTITQSGTTAASIDPTLGDVFVLNGDGALNSGVWEVNLATVPAAGQVLYLICNNAASNGNTVFDFDTNFRGADSTVTQATTKVNVFVSDGSNAVQFVAGATVA